MIRTANLLFGTSVYLSVRPSVLLTAPGGEMGFATRGMVVDAVEDGQRPWDAPPASAWHCIRSFGKRRS